MHTITTIRGLECAARAEREAGAPSRRRERKLGSALDDTPPKPPRLTIVTTGQVVALLDQLARSGMYGAAQTRESAAEEILRAALREIDLPRRRP